MSAIQKGLLRLSVLLALLCTINIAFTQNYQKLTLRIDSLAVKGLPKSALTEVDKLDQLARKEKNVPFQIKAVIYRMTFQSHIEEKKLEAIIKRLKLDINKAQYPVKPILQSVLATIYYQYYQENRWEFNKRSHLEKPSEDFTQWDLQTILNESIRLYKISLSDYKTEQSTPIDILNGVLTGDKNTRYLRPTLYDLLVHQALDFFLSDESAVTKPKLAFDINDVRYFSNSRTYTEFVINTTDTTSTYFLALKYLQQATLFHLQNHHDEALADLDIKRMEFLHDKVELSDKDSLYTAALKQIATTFSTKLISADAWLALANFEKEKDSLRLAMEYARKAVASFPKSMGARNAEVLMKEIKQKELTVSVESIYIPGEPILAQIKYSNVKKVSYQIYRLTQSQFKQYKIEKNKIENLYDLENTRKWITQYLKKLKLIRKADLQLPDPEDYASHRCDFKIDALNPGNYVIWFEDNQKDNSSGIQYADFQVSRIAFVARKNPLGNVEILVMDRKTGKPLKNVYVTNINYTNNKDKPIITEGLTNDSGVFSSVKVQAGYSDFQMIFEGDTLFTKNNYFSYTALYNTNVKPSNKTVLFTDRQIYRPGQTIYFKGILLNLYKNNGALETNRDISVDFNDVNDKLLSTLKLQTNEFGSFSGSFIFPQNLLNGNVTLKTTYGSVTVKVEEYKRNSFEINFTPVKESYKLNDSIKIGGSVKAFSGYGLSQAQVVYHITRTQTNIGKSLEIYRNWYLEPVKTEIKTDTIKTNDQGIFQISFKAIPGDKIDLNTIIYNYAVNLDVTDASGETHSATTEIKVANNNLVIRAEIPEEFMASDSAQIEAGIYNLHGLAQKGSINVQIYALQSQSNLVKSKLWDKPDQFILDKKEFKVSFPDYAYNNEDDFKTWPRGKCISDVNTQVNETNQSFINLWPLKNQTSGIYQVVISAKNDHGDTTSTTSYVNLLADHPKPLDIDHWVKPIHNIVKPGEDAEFLVGLEEPAYVLMEKIENNVIVSSQWLYIQNGPQRIKVASDEKEKEITVQFLMVIHNRAYYSNQNIQYIIPDKELDIRMITFRNILQPGEKDQMKLQVSAPQNEKKAVEMVADLYDASLDDFVPSRSWKGKLNIPNRNMGNYFGWKINNFVEVIETQSLLSPSYDYQQQHYEYENLKLFDYNNFDSYNYDNFLTLAKRRIEIARIDRKLEELYKRNAALVKNGFDICGKIINSSDGSPFTDVNIAIKGTNILTQNNLYGYFKIKVPVNSTLTFSYHGYLIKEIVVTKANIPNIDLTLSLSMLKAMGVKGKRKQIKASIKFTPPVIAADDQVKEEMKSQDQLSDKQTISIADIKGTSEGTDISGISKRAVVEEEEKPLLVIEDTSKAPLFRKIDEKDDTSSKESQQPIQTRKNFNETAFFYPQLRTDENGEILIDFTIPEALTKWRFKAFAHTKDLQTGYLERMIVTQKQLSISANMPRFLREGDTITISARLVNLTTSPLKGKVQIQLFNALNMQPVSLLINNKDEKQNFDLAAATNKPISFRLFIPAGLEALTYKLTADAGQFTDGEENTLPVLSNRILVTESMPMMVRPGQERSFTFDKLVNQNSNTLKSKTLTLEYTQNPVWYAIQAMPYMMEFPYECSEQIFSRYYANSLATNLVNKFPVVKQVFDQWKNTNSPELLSNLEKNQELKATLLEETPWLRDAMNESEQKKRVALLFDLNKMSYELKQNLDKLEKKQLPGGAFPWFGGEYPDRYITQHILEGIGQLVHMNVADAKNQTLKSITDKALSYLDNALIEDANNQKKYKTYEGRNVSSMEIHSWFTKSYFTGRKESSDLQPLLANYLQLAEKQWVGLNIYEQGMIALTMQRNNKPEVAQMIIRSLNETAQHSDDMGMYWAKNQLGYYWYQSPVETQSLMIELFTEAGNDPKAVEEMKIWLLRSKQTSNWKTTKATAAACYALLMKGDSWQESNGPSVIKLGGKSLEELKPDIKADVGTGYIKTAWTDEQVKPSLGKVAIQNNGKTISWGAIHWQYLENLDKISSSKTDIQLERKYFIQKQSDTGPVLTAVDAQHQPRTGDLLKVVVYLKAGRDFEYVQLKDMRPSGTEPVDVISSFKYQDGLYYYQVTKDVATNFFISNLAKGSYVFEYRLRVVQPGNFSTGITSVQSMYAPEFNAHSEGMRMLIRPN